MCKTKDLEDTMELVSILAVIATQSLHDGVSIDVVIDSLCCAVGAVVCQKHSIEVYDPAATTEQIVAAATKIVMDTKIDPSRN